MKICITHDLSPSLKQFLMEIFMAKSALTQAELLALIATVAAGDGTDPAITAKVDTLTLAMTDEQNTNIDQQALIEALIFQLSHAVPSDFPVVSGVTPSAGGVAGGTTVTISGTGFADATSVVFGDTEATSYSVVSDTQITAVTPSAPASDVNVIVTNAAGPSVDGTPNDYTFQ